MKLAEVMRIIASFPKPKNREEQEQIYEVLLGLGFDLEEFYKEIEMPSRLVTAFNDLTFPTSMVQMHSHAFYEIVFCRSDGGVDYLLGAERYKLHRGDIIIVAPGTSHRPLFHADSAEPFERYVIWLNTEMAKEIHRATNPGEYMTPVSRLLHTAGTNWEFLAEDFRICVQESERGETDWEIIVFGHALELLAHLHRAMLDADMIQTKAEKPELLDLVMAYVEKHLAEKITLEDISRQFWVSQSTITQTFRQKMGVSFYRCVTQRRLIAAKNLILEGIPMDAVSSRCGFSDYSTFYRAFVKEYNLSPRQFKKMQTGSDE